MDGAINSDMLTYKMWLEVTGEPDWLERFVKFYSSVRELAPESWGDWINVKKHEDIVKIQSLAQQHNIRLSLALA